MGLYLCLLVLRGQQSLTKHFMILNLSSVSRSKIKCKHLCDNRSKRQGDDVSDSGLYVNKVQHEVFFFWHFWKTYSFALLWCLCCVSQQISLMCVKLLLLLQAETAENILQSIAHLQSFYSVITEVEGM